MKNNSYIGITIGPIYRTLQLADKTREIWGASYLFSYLCKELLKAVLTIPGFDKARILLPSPEYVSSAQPGVGLYPDRIILQSLPGDYENLLPIIEKVKTDFVSKLLTSIDGSARIDPYAKLYKKEVRGVNEKALVQNHLMNYFQVYSLEAVHEDLQLKNPSGKDLGVVKCMNLYLDHLELRASVTGFDPDPLKVFLRGINHTFILRDAFGPGFSHFPSLPEIATTELRFIAESNNLPLFKDKYDYLVGHSLKQAIRKEKERLSQELSSDEPSDADGMSSDKAEDDLMDMLLGSDTLWRDELRTYHRYVAIVHADGDNMGKLLEKLHSDSEVNRFSGDLITFSIKASEIIAGYRFNKGSDLEWGYGGAPVYIGGDDMVFFAPVASRVLKNGRQEFQTVFHLISDIDDAFNAIFNERQDTGDGVVKYKKYPEVLEMDRPCVSYGVTITYLKYPLSEAMELSRALLEKVKTNDYPTRGRIHFRVQKHSGQWFGGVVDKNISGLFSGFTALLDSQNNHSLQLVKSEKFINSLSKRLLQYECVLESLARNNEDTKLAAGLEALFENVFNEPIHKEFSEYLHEICGLLAIMLSGSCHDIAAIDNVRREGRIREAITTIYAMLRFIHFIRDNEFRN